MIECSKSRRPPQSDLKRAVSTAYYACFHALCRTYADMMVGASAKKRSQGAWTQAYRYVAHRQAADVLTKQLVPLDFPAPIRRFGVLFKNLQDRRHAADYDPHSRFAKSEAIATVEDAETALSALDGVSPKDRRALAILVLLGKPRT